MMKVKFCRKKYLPKFRWIAKRLRTENRLLRQRIDYLEQESSALADRLVRGQVNLAQETENCMSISNELLKLRDINSDAHRRLEEAYDTIRDLSCKSNEGVVEKSTQVDDTSMIEHILALQQELIATHIKEADSENLIKELKQRVQDLELSNKRLKERPPENGIAGLQEELISAKMREAEASLSLKEMRQRLAELEIQWAFGCFKFTKNLESHSFAQTYSNATQSARQRLAKLKATLIGMPNSESSESLGENGLFSIIKLTFYSFFCGSFMKILPEANTVRDLEDQLMGIRIREVDTVAELKEMRQKVMELETNNHVITNQLKRQDQEIKQLKEEKEQILQKEKELMDSLKDERRRVIEAESELKEKSVMQRLKFSEAMQHIADLKQTIAQLELKKAEKWTQAQLRGSSVCDLDEESSVGAFGSHHSVTSGDAVSIESEDLTALITDMTVRLPETNTNEDILLNQKDASSNEMSEKSRDFKKHQLEEDNDTTDSGLQMSDSL
ncbi:unnamed protein product [Dracunculus medinensis]|uniref:Myosin_tail_1 domain-containing protein n=1 Tax=Dracunculus medinensis TaxID=318479 RepID=A0A0N4UBB5_DRAME|nr:unnamed protein product [Dracunculus medinensis]